MNALLVVRAFRLLYVETIRSLSRQEFVFVLISLNCDGKAAAAREGEKSEKAKYRKPIESLKTKDIEMDPDPDVCGYLCWRRAE